MCVIKTAMNSAALLVLLCLSLTTQAIVDGHEYPFDSDDALQNVSRAKLFKQLAEELRCPKCQNQNLADSDAMIAGDLRRELYSQVKEGKNSDQIVDFMVNRYGEFVLYRPALNNKTLALWYGPFVLLALAVIIFISVVVARKSSNKPKVTSTQLDTKPSADPLSTDEQKRLDELLNSAPSTTHKKEDL